MVGPGLKGATSRNNIAWLVKWVHNSQAVVASGDAYAVKIYNEFSKTPMTSFPSLSEDDIKAIFAYVDKAATAAPAAATPAAARATQSRRSETR